MKVIPACLMGFVFVGTVIAQESHWDSWTLQPALSFGKLFPGAPLDYRAYASFPPDMVPGIASPQFRYEGTQMGISVRAFPAPARWLAVTFGGGVTWFYRADTAPIHMSPAVDQGVGEQLAPGDFMIIPITLGVQIVYPTVARTDFMLFAGISASANFISGNIPMSQQIKPGFGAAAGFAVKVFEVGLRYESFSDMQNLGAYLGLRLNPFDLSFSGGTEK